MLVLFNLQLYVKYSTIITIAEMEVCEKVQKSLWYCNRVSAPLMIISETIMLQEYKSTLYENIFTNTMMIYFKNTIQVNIQTVN